MTSRNAPSIENAPGLTWKPRVRGRWEARWAARADLVRAGFLPKSFQLYMGEWPPADPETAGRIAERCRLFQDAMHAWAAKRKPTPAVYNGMLCTLIDCYLTDPVSPFHKVRYATKQSYRSLCKRILEDRGSELIVDLKYRTFRLWYDEWSFDGRIPMAHGLFTMLRVVMSFGATILERDECAKAQTILHGMKIPQGSARTKWINAAQASDVRAMARQLARPSVALAQAFQFECMLRQKDVIGEYVPISEPGVSDVFDGNKKWLRGLRWEEIDAAFVLHHVTSKRSKRVDVPLVKAAMVVDELNRRFPGFVDAHGTLHRELLPPTGAIILSETSSLPYTNYGFRRLWREIARAAGVPDDVFNMDSRSGAISEATDAGADLEHVRHAATHGDIAMTQRYSRNSEEKIAKVMDQRQSHRRGKNGTEN